MQKIKKFIGGFKKMKKKFLKWIPPFVGLMLIAIATVGFTSAYLSRSPGNVKNVITTGSVKIKLDEDKWNPNNAKDLYPLQSISKNPKITNTGKNDAVVFLEVSVPCVNISTVGSNGLKTEKTKRELFTFSPKADTWSLVKKTNSGTTETYVYGYKSTLKPNEVTTTLFDSVQAINYVEDEGIADNIYKVEVVAKAIQGNIANKGLEAVYNDLIAQESSDNGIKSVGDEEIKVEDIVNP